MKKILFSILLGFCSFSIFSQQTPLSTILTWFETNDVPTESQYRIAWSNSYNAVSDGMWDLTGYPSIGFVPYTTMRVGKFSQIAGFPTDTSVALNFNGTLKVSNLWVNGQRVNGTGGSSGWELSGSTIHPISTGTKLAVGTTSSGGYTSYILGTSYVSGALTTNRLNLFNSLGNTGSISIDGTGNLSFSDNVTSETSLSSIIAGGAWIKTNNLLSYGDSVSIGSTPGRGDSLFSVYGTMYVEGDAMFRMPINADSGLVTDDYITTPRLNFEYGGHTGRIDLFTTGGKMKFYDADFPSGITLGSLGGGYFSKSGNTIKPILNTDNVVIGGITPNSIYDFQVNGGSYFGGTSVYANGLSLGYGTKIQFTNGYISNGPQGLTFNDGFNGTKTLTELAGITSDSLSVSLLNVDTVYWNGAINKKLFSPQTSNLFLQIDTAQWRFESFNTGTVYQPVFHTNALQMDAIDDAIQSNPGWEQQGKLYLSSSDTVFKYATGKAGEWRSIASEEFVSNALAGVGAINLSLDTLYFNAGDNFITGTGSNQLSVQSHAGGNTMLIGVGATPGIQALGSRIDFAAGYLSFQVGGDEYKYNGTYWFNGTDTLSDMGWVRSYVATHASPGGAGTPGGGLTTLQYNNGGAFGGFWAYNGTDVVPTSSTGIAWSSSSFIKGYSSTADSVNMGKMINANNSYTTETNLKYGYKSIMAYAGGYLNGYSKLWTNYSDADANNGKLYGIYSHTYTDDNFASTGNTSYSNAGRFILQNRGTTSIGGASAGTTYLNGVYGEITGTIDSTSTPGTYRVAAIYGKNSNAGNAKTYAGYFDGNVKAVGNFTATGNIISTVLRSNSATKLAGYWDNGSSAPTNVNRLNYDGYLYATSLFGIGTNLTALNATQLTSGTIPGARGVASGSATVSFLEYNGTTAADGMLYGSTTDPSTTTRLNYGGNFYANNLYAVADLKSAVINTSNTTKTAGNWYTNTTPPSNTNRLNFDGALHITNLYNYGYMYYSKYAALTDTVGIVMYPGGRLDTVSLIAVSGGGGGTGTINGSILANQIAFGSALNTIGGNSGFLFTGSSRTAGAFYTGTQPPIDANRFNYDGDWYVHTLNASAEIISSVIKTNGAVKLAGYFDNGSTPPSNTNRTNYDGNLYATNFIASTDLKSSVINTSSTIRTTGNFYLSTVNLPTGTTRLNYDGNLYVNNLIATQELKSAVINTNSATRLAGNFYTGTAADPSSTTRLNYDGNLYVTNLFASTDIRSSVINTSGGARTAGYFYTGITPATSSTRLNYDGYFYPRRLVSIDSIGGTYIGIARYTRYAAWSHTGYLYADSTHLAAFALDMPLPTTKEMLERGSNGEMQWFVNDNGEVKKTTDFGNLSLGGQIGALMASSELQLRHIAELEKKISDLEKQSRKRRR